MALLIPGPAGDLEAAVRGTTDPAAGWLVVCHAHPQFGGSMDNNVVAALVRAAGSARFGALAFNFRGVGASAGRFDGGEGETEDLLAALDYLADKEACPADRVVVAGYSFGAAVAARTLALGCAPRAMLWVAPPVAMAPLPADALAWPGPKQVVVGTRDQFCPRAELETVCAGATPPIPYRFIEDADHFFAGHEHEVAEVAHDFLCALDLPDAS